MENTKEESNWEIWEIIGEMLSRISKNVGRNM